MPHPDLNAFSSIIMTTDLSPASLRALGPAADLARRGGWPLILYHVVHDPALATGLDVPQSIREARDELGALARARVPAEVPTEVVVDSAEDVVATIVDFAARRRGILVISTHGRTGIRRLVIGSVTEDVVRRSTVPVLCVPQKDG